MGPTHGSPNSAMEVDGPCLMEEILLPPAQWGDNLRPPREITVYTAEGVVMAEKTLSGFAKSSSVARIRSPPYVPDEQERPSRSSRHTKSPSSPRKCKTSTNAPLEFPQSRLRSTTLRSPLQSPRRYRVEEDELQEVLAEIIQDQSLTLARATHRQNKASRSQGGSRDVQESRSDPQSGRDSPMPLGNPLRLGLTGESQEEGPGKARRRIKSRRPKRKADAVHELLPDDTPIVQGARGIHPLQDLQKFVSRAATRKELSSTPSNRMEQFADVMMWRDVPKSALLFGAGCFCILSASVIQDVRCRSLTFIAYAALVYLAAVFLHRNFLRGGPNVHESRSWGLGESEALELLRAILPAINLSLEKLGELFRGDPSTTLKVASILWLLAQAGYYMTIWSLLRMGFILMFILPKLYSCYSHQLHAQGEACADRVWNAWSAYAHKKAAIFGTLVVAWNLSSATSRLYGVFMILVAIKLYSYHLADQINEQNYTDEPVAVCNQLGERPITPPRIPYLPSQERLPNEKIEAG